MVDSGALTVNVGAAKNGMIKCNQNRGEWRVESEREESSEYLHHYLELAVLVKAQEEKVKLILKK